MARFICGRLNSRLWKEYGEAVRITPTAKFGEVFGVVENAAFGQLARREHVTMNFQGELDCGGLIAARLVYGFSIHPRNTPGRG